MNLTIIRHGKPDEIGTNDPPLTPLGVKQAESAATALAGNRFDYLVASTALRAQQTAEPFCRLAGLPLHLDAAFLEIDYGDAEYVRVEEARARQDETWDLWRSRLRATVDDPTVAAFIGGIQKAVTELAEVHAGKEVLIFAHGGVINALTSWATYSNRLWIMLPDYCGISRFGFHKGRLVVKTLNEIGHLAEGASLTAADLTGG